jgi:hypothetical protein
MKISLILSIKNSNFKGLKKRRISQENQLDFLATNH